MPTFSRRTLRQELGRFYLRDTTLGRTTGSWGTQAASANIIDSAQADPTASGEQLYQRAWLRLIGSAGFIQDVRVGSFNTGSGAYLSQTTLATTIFSGMQFEVHEKLSPVEKDGVLDLVIRDVRYRQDIPIWAIDQGHVYSLGTDIKKIFNIYYLSDPTDSLNTGRHELRWWKFETTSSGQQLRIDPALVPSYQLVIDAVLEPSLGAGDLATINLPSVETILWGATARCYWLLEQHSPAQEVAKYKEKRLEAAHAYSRLTKRYAPHSAQRILLDEVW